MKHYRTVAAIATAVTLLVAFGLEAAPARDGRGFPGLQWRFFESSELGVRVRYPARLFKLEEAAREGDGRVFVSPDGRARLLVGVIENRDRLSLQEYQRSVKRDSYAGASIDYSPIGSNWFVLSGVIEDKIFYEKVVFGCGGERIGGFALVYPAAKKRLYNAVVEHIEDSYRFSPEAQGCR